MLSCTVKQDTRLQSQINKCVVESLLSPSVAFQSQCQASVTSRGDEPITEFSCCYQADCKSLSPPFRLLLSRADCTH